LGRVLDEASRTVAHVDGLTERPLERPARH
jgi:hypothetical protein